MHTDASEKAMCCRKHQPMAASGASGVASCVDAMHSDLAHMAGFVFNTTIDCLLHARTVCVVPLMQSITN